MGTKMIKHVMVAVAGALSVGVASATDVNLGDITGDVFLPTTVSKAKDLSGFVDRYFFTVSAPSVGSATVADFQLASGTGFLWNIDSLKLELYDDFGTVGAQDGSDVLVNTWTGDFIQATGAPIPAGNLFVRVSGIANGDGGGVYTWHASALPVPEPEAYSMMLAGLGVLGFMARRRRQQASA